MTSSVDVAGQTASKFVETFKKYFPAGQANQDKNATTYHYSALNIVGN